MSKEGKIRKIIRLKRYEVPRDGYFEDFVEEFRNRREETEAARESFSGIGSLRQWFRERKSPGFVIGASAAYAAVVLMIVWFPKGPGAGSDEHRRPVIYQPEQDGDPLSNPRDSDAPRKEF